MIKHFLNKTNSSVVGANIKHDVVRNIEMKLGPSIFCKTKRLSTEKLYIAKTEYEIMHQEDIISPSNSFWASPIQKLLTSRGRNRRCILLYVLQY